MTAYFAAGNAANAVWCAHTLVASPTLETLFPDSHALSNELAELARFSDLTADASVIYDLNMLYDGGFEIGSSGQAPLDTDPKGRLAWQIESGTPTISQGVTAHSGTNELRLNATDEAAFYDIPVIAGNTYRWDGWLYGGGTHSAQVEIINIDTGNYLNSAGSWVAAQAYIHTRATASWGQDTDTFTVESAPTGGDPNMTLRLRLTRSSTGTTAVYFDDLAIFPDVDTAALFGARYGQGVDAEIWSADDTAGADNLEGTLPRNGFRSAVELDKPATPRRWWRLFFDGGPSVRAIDFAQLWLSERKSFSKGAGVVDSSYEMPQTRLTNRALRRGAEARIVQPLTFKVLGATDLELALSGLYRGSRGGVEPVLLWPDISDPSRVFHGRLDPKFKQDYLSPTASGVTVEFAEDYLPGFST